MENFNRIKNFNCCNQGFRTNDKPYKNELNRLKFHFLEFFLVYFRLFFFSKTVSPFMEVCSRILRIQYHLLWSCLPSYHWGCCWWIHLEIWISFVSTCLARYQFRLDVIFPFNSNRSCTYKHRWFRILNCFYKYQF